jgi:hypothetical protein
MIFNMQLIVSFSSPIQKHFREKQNGPKPISFWACLATGGIVME